jgi:hypothetical protein
MRIEADKDINVLIGSIKKAERSAFHKFSQYQSAKCFCLFVRICKGKIAMYLSMLHFKAKAPIVIERFACAFDNASLVS